MHGLLVGVSLGCGEGFDPASGSESGPGDSLAAAITVEMTGDILTSTPSYDYSASYMIDQFDDDKHKMWWCGRGDDGDDVIFYSERPGHDASWPAPQTVLKHARPEETARYGPNPSFEGIHLCDPSVVRGKFAVGGASYSYALYYTTDSPTLAVSNNRIGVAFSNDGIQWTRMPSEVIGSVTVDNAAYGAGQQVAFSADGGAAVHLVYTEVHPTGAIDYLYRYSTDGIRFGEGQILSRDGFGPISPLNPAIAAAPGGGYLHVAKVNRMYPDFGAKNIAVYRIPFDRLTSGTWERVIQSEGIKPVEVEPGFVTDAYGSLAPYLPTVSTIFACSGASSPYGWDLCYGNATLLEGT